LLLLEEPKKSERKKCKLAQFKWAMSMNVDTQKAVKQYRTSYGKTPQVKIIFKSLSVMVWDCHLCEMFNMQVVPHNFNFNLMELL
jgi:hypothetical protein